MTVDSPEHLLARARQVSPDLAARLVAWQRQQGRHHLPWQHIRDPYRVWLSEIMLQQTQVTTVLGYYARFLERFPDVQALAAAPLDEVLALWAGLGYYSRARNLHRCAQAVVTQHGGQFPASAAELQSLPGIGPSTAAAIAAFCFDERISIMDGNVKRVLSRVLGWEQDLAVRVHERALIDAAQVLVPDDAADMPAYTQGLMDLGATVCTPRQPACADCPWSDLCVARRSGDPQRLPIKTQKLKRGQREHRWLWLQWREQVWLEQMPATGVWAGLWTLPLLDSDEAVADLVGDEVARHLDAQPRIKHVFTHLDWYLHPRRAVLDAANEAAVRDLAERLTHRVATQGGTGRWVAMPELKQYGVPAPLRKLLVG